MNNIPSQTDGPDSMIPTPACAHTQVISVQLKYADGQCSEYWKCAACGKRFEPVMEAPQTASWFAAGSDVTNIKAANVFLNQERTRLEARIKELEADLDDAVKVAHLNETLTVENESLQIECDSLRLKLESAAEPLRWRRFSDEKPKRGSLYVWRTPTGGVGGPHTYDDDRILSVEWIPYPLDPEPLPEPKPEPDACDRAFRAFCDAHQDHTLNYYDGYVWRTAWDKAREQKL